MRLLYAFLLELPARKSHTEKYVGSPFLFSKNDASARVRSACVRVPISQYPSIPHISFQTFPFYSHPRASIPTRPPRYQASHRVVLDDSGDSSREDIHASSGRITSVPTRVATPLRCLTGGEAPGYAVAISVQSPITRWI